jgi:Tfp pilus assembly protein FimT
VEILVVVSIIGILATLAVSSFLELSEKYKVEAETKQLYADLMDVRGRAVQRNRFHFVRFTLPNAYATYEDSNPSPDGDWTFDGGDKQVASVTVKHAIIADAGVVNFFFNRNGIASDNGTIQFPLTANADYDCITIRPTRIKMGKHNGTICVEK